MYALHVGNLLAELLVFLLELSDQIFVGILVGFERLDVVLAVDLYEVR